ncbi:DUF2267 domain-containing protein [Micromonospora sp. NPDC049679]|uniref:DUF2267 domain-containing protein n=1 Tax=Micromonospora sp. NPDC049679 TaxID=3155920 RepID=UPI0033F2ED21
MTTTFAPRTTVWQMEQAVLRTLAERLPSGEAALLAGALPPALAPNAQADGPTPQRFDAAELLRRVRARAGLRGAADDEVRDGVAATLERLLVLCPAAVLYKVQVPLPDDIRGLFPEPVRLRAAGTR